MKDLFDVGKKKIVGYLPLSTIKMYSNIIYKDTVKYIADFCIINNLKHVIIKNGKTGSGALYVWDAAKLNKFIEDNKKVFGMQLIFDDEKFISKIEQAAYPIEMYPKIYKLIGQSFSDTRFENIFEKYKDVK